jgi:hypothetical protein
LFSVPTHTAYPTVVMVENHFVPQKEEEEEEEEEEEN